MVFKAYSVSKKLGDKAMAYLATFNITKKKFKNIVPIYLELDKGLYIPEVTPTANHRLKLII